MTEIGCWKTNDVNPTAVTSISMNRDAGIDTCRRVGVVKAPLGMVTLVPPSCITPPRRPTMAEVVVVSFDGHSISEGDVPSLRDVDVPGAVARCSPQDTPMKTSAAVTTKLFKRLFDRADIAGRIVRVAWPVGLDGGHTSQVQRTCLIRTS